MFWLMLSALVFYVLGFSTVGWEKVSVARGRYWIGLWLTCADTDHAYDEGIPFILHIIHFSSKPVYFSIGNYEK